MRRPFASVILVAICLSLLPLPTHAESQRVFYFHSSFLLDELPPSQATQALKMSKDTYYFWNTSAFSVDATFTGTLNVTLWMNYTERPTQYRIKLAVNEASGDFVEHMHSFTPIINSSSPTPYQVILAAFSVRAGESIVIGLLRQWTNGTYSPAACIFFDSPNAPSSLSIPVSPATTTTTTTQQQTTTQYQTTTATTATTAAAGPGVGLGFAIIGIGAGVASALAGFAVAVSGRPSSDVFAYGGYYYCKKHRVPVWYVGGRLWCPVDQEYLRV